MISAKKDKPKSMPTMTPVTNVSFLGGLNADMAVALGGEMETKDVAVVVVVVVEEFANSMLAAVDVASVDSQ